MHRSDDFLNAAELDYDGFKDLLRKDWGRYTPTAIEPEAFTGRVRARTVCGFVAMDLTCNAYSIERTVRDVRLDDMEHYYAALQVAGDAEQLCEQRPLVDGGGIVPDLGVHGRNGLIEPVAVQE